MKDERRVTEHVRHAFVSVYEYLSPHVLVYVMPLIYFLNCRSLCQRSIRGSVGGVEYLSSGVV